MDSFKLHSIDKLLSPKEVAEILGVTEQTLAVWRSLGSQELRFIKVGRAVRYRPEDVKKYIEQNGFTHTL